MTKKEHIIGLNVMKSYLQKKMREINYEGLGELDAREVCETIDFAIEAIEAHATSDKRLEIAIKTSDMRLEIAIKTIARELAEYTSCSHKHCPCFGTCKFEEGNLCADTLALWMKNIVEEVSE